jgi:ABC-type uncharacterized transport system permease subunit
LCKSFLERSNKSAEISRALLFTASGAGVVFAIQQIEAGERGHLIAAAIFAAAIIVLYWSWDRQKALLCRLLLAVVRSQISSPPSADSAAAAALDVAQNFFGLEAINR